MSNANPVLHPEAKKLAEYLIGVFDRAAGVSMTPLLKSAIVQYAELHPHDHTQDILSGWCADDIYTVVKNNTDDQFTVSEEDAILVLERAERRMDANQGINWDVLWFHVETLVDENQITLIPSEDYDDEED